MIKSLHQTSVNKDEAPPK